MQLDWRDAFGKERAKGAKATKTHDEDRHFDARHGASLGLTDCSAPAG
jgi:hypothetical protein